jgi:hypothetical protein
LNAEGLRLAGWWKQYDPEERSPRRQIDMECSVAASRGGMVERDR